MVQMNLTYCKENEFQPFGKNSHFEILRDCMASSRTNLHGLDNTAAEELDLFRHFMIFLKILEKIYLFVNIHTQRTTVTIFIKSCLHENRPQDSCKEIYYLC